ncbi:MAG: dephospho-CoA kinase [Bacteroidaceae bacterium]|nr:dephospho-CoA kinase [Bacteroidaceae bacterium]MBR7166777.1 dephospho-CoA kinase [Bacteroidaceae bacterium]
MSAIRVAVTGGIGSGKSVVSHLLTMMGVPVYDCDSRAKALMESDTLIRQGLQRMFGEECYTPDGKLNRKWLAARIFVDKDAIKRVNALVHPRVKSDFVSWAEERSEQIVAVETAILFESKLHEAVDKVLLVWADAETCISRVEGRNGMTRSQVVSRMNNQMPLDELLLLCDYAVRNDADSPLIPQIVETLQELSATIE